MKSVSIIIPTYKPKDYIWTCLDSLCSQTMKSTAWEVILVLNGCKKPWLSQLEQYAAKHKDIDIHIIQTDEPGVSNARNVGIDNAKGEYITFLDDDDYVSETYLNDLYDIATPDTIAASYTIAFNDKGKHVPYYLEQEYRNRAECGKQPFYKAKKYFGGPCMKLIHRSIIGDTRFDRSFQLGEDSLFMFMISNRIKYINFTGTNAIYYRRLRSNSASNSLSRSEHFRNCIRIIEKYCHTYHSDKSYSFSFLASRILGALHTAIVYKPQI